MYGNRSGRDVFGCKEAPTVLTNEINADWIEVSTEWTDSDDSQLSYVVSGSSNHLDIAWYTNPSDTIMGFIEEYTYSNGKLEGTYTSFENTDPDEEFDISLTFSYAAPTLTVGVVADGVLGNKTLYLIPVDD